METNKTDRIFVKQRKLKPKKKKKRQSKKWEKIFASDVTNMA